MTRVAVIVYPGSNCDEDCVRGVEVAGGSALRVWHKSTELPPVDGIILPGGFSYGDYLRPGAIARFSPISEQIAAFAKGGGPVIGICNGFQILTELGLLPGALLRNRSLKFRCQDQWVRRQSEFGLAAGSPDLSMAPIAHADGAYYADEQTLKRLEDEDRIAFRYCDADGEITADSNPNGSVSNIAGILSKNGRILGLMPHPERNAEPILGDGSGLAVLGAWLAAMEASV